VGRDFVFEELKTVKIFAIVLSGINEFHIVFGFGFFLCME
jgi:hypothetical protein